MSLLGFDMHPLEGFNFMLRVEGALDVPCRSVRAFSKENEFEYVQEGGVNDYVHMLRKPISSPFTFQVERYVGVDLLDPLPLGANLMLPMLLFVSHKGNDFEPDQVGRCYTFTGCTVMGKEYGTLNAESSDLLVETVTISYRHLLVVNIPTQRQENVDFGAKALADTARKDNEAAREAPLEEKDGNLKGPGGIRKTVPPKVEPRFADIAALTDTARAANEAVQDPRIADIPALTLANASVTVAPRIFDPKRKNDTKSPETYRIWKPTESHQ